MAPLNFGPKSQTPAPAAAPQTAPAQAPAQRPALGGSLARPPLQAQAPVVAQRSVFAGIEDAKASFDSNYPKEGHYFALIRGVKYMQNRQRRPMVIIEMTCVGVLAKTDQPGHRIGEEFSHILMADKDPFLGNMKSFIAGCTGSSPDEVTQAVCEEVTGDSQPLAGTIVELTSKVIITKTTQKPFTVVSYKREVKPSEVGNLPEMDEQTANRIFGAGVLQQAIQTELGQG